MLILTIENGLRFSCRSFLCTFSVFCVTWSCLHKNKYIEISCYRVSLIHWGNFWQIKSSPVSQCPAVAPSHVQIFSQISQEDFSGTQPPRHCTYLVCIYKGCSRFIHWQDFKKCLLCSAHGHSVDEILSVFWLCITPSWPLGNATEFYVNGNFSQQINCPSCWCAFAWTLNSYILYLNH